jgi:hypothetical protein
MNVEDLRFLADRAETVVGRPDQRLAEVHARIKSARRQRAATVAASASAAVLALVVGLAVLTGPTGSNKDNGPIPPANSDTTAPDAPAAATARQIAYGEGWPILAIHVGDRVVDISDLVPRGNNTPVYLNTTDDGVVFDVDTEESRIWFTDGTAIVPIGQVGHYTHIGSSPVATGTSGSLAAWLDWSGGSAQLVVYDTSKSAEVTRIDCPRCGSPEITGTSVYWNENGAASEALTTMYDAETGETRRVPATAYAEDVASQPRGVIVGDSLETGVVTSAGWPAASLQFSAEDGELVPVLDQGPSSPGVTDWGPTSAFDTATHRSLRFRLPDNFDGTRFQPFDWLDDDRMALVADSDPGDDGWQILDCRISTGQCQLAVGPTQDRRWAANLDFP